MTAPAAEYPLTGANKGVVPPAGDKVAWRWFWGGAACYVLFASLLYAGVRASTATDATTALLSLLGLGDRGSPVMVVLVGIGVFVFLAASLRLLNDQRKLHAEELDVAWVMKHPDAPGLVFAPDEAREKMYTRGQRDMEQSRMQVETLMDDRVRRLGEAQRDRNARVSPDELRRMAEARLSALGSDGRFASGLLLLLAVLGTFAGVKASLPRLIEAVTSSADALDGRMIADPLETVAAAFGANSLALVGAIALGIMAHGIVAGRRNLLDRLEFASEPLYRGLRSGEHLDPLLSAIATLRDTSDSLNATGAAIQQLDGGIADLAGSFSDAFDRLGDTLTELGVQQQQAIAEQTASELQRLQERVAQMGEIVDANTRLFQGLVESITTRSRESQELVAGSLRAMERLDEGMRFVASLDTRMAGIEKGARERLDAMDAESKRLAARMERIGESVERAGRASGEVAPTLAEVRRVFEQAVTALQEQERQMRQGWQDLAQQMGQQLRSMGASHGRSFEFAVPTFKEQFLTGLAQGAGIAGVASVIWLLYLLMGWLRTFF